MKVKDGFTFIHRYPVPSRTFFILYLFQHLKSISRISLSHYLAAGCGLFPEVYSIFWYDYIAELVWKFSRIFYIRFLRQLLKKGSYHFPLSYFFCCYSFFFDFFCL